jgi:hypothetical protein
VSEVKTPRLFVHVARPVLVFEPANGTSIPSIWEEKTYWFHLKFFGLIPIGAQAIVVTFEEESEVFKVRDNGYSQIINHWDHEITIQRKSGHTLYRDTLDVHAGIITPFVWLFARVFFAHRQRRLKKLVLSDFEYDEV